jgi:hypothetical protein
MVLGYALASASTSSWPGVFAYADMSHTVNIGFPVVALRAVAAVD